MHNILVILFFIIMTSCSSEDKASLCNTERAMLNEPFSIAYQKTVNLTEQQLIITFKEITEDSRCPEDVQCVWAGNAAIHITINNEVFLLSSNPRIASENQYGEYTIHFINLTPYPNTQRKPAKPEDYCAKLMIKRKDNLHTE